MYGYICEMCGAHLDPGERCDCEESRKIERERKRRKMQAEAVRLIENGMGQQMEMIF